MMSKRVLIRHSYCRQVSDAPEFETAAQGRVVLATDNCPHCGQTWGYGFDVIGPMTDEYLAQKAGVDATGAALRLASELGMELHGIQGTGAGGELTTDDVERTYMARLEAAEPPAVSELADAAENLLREIVNDAIAAHEQRWHTGSLADRLDDLDGPDGTGGTWYAPD